MDLIGLSSIWIRSVKAMQDIFNLETAKLAWMAGDFNGGIVEFLIACITLLQLR